MTQCRKIYGLTGGISTGKSTVSNYLIDQGFKLIDADKIAHKNMEPAGPAYEKILAYFGREILNPDASINRKLLGDIVFSDPGKLEILNQISHRAVIDQMKAEIDRLEAGPVFLDIPLLIEEYDQLRSMGLDFHKIILVYTSPELQLERLMKRDAIAREDAEKKIRNQMDIDSKRAYADYIIDNTGSLGQLEENIGRLLKELEIQEG